MSRSESEKVLPLSDADAKKLEESYAIVDRADRLAELFCKAAETQISVRQKILDVLKLAIETDAPSREQVKKILKEIHDEDWRMFVKSAWAKIGIVVWTLVTALISAYIGHIWK